ncbi:MAG: P-loop NTPase fold protein, partial [Acutalibacteraceae bacterium]|nr:P-loop NTPase fold protein [Acutalibacteraceae bacterium]
MNDTMIDLLDRQEFVDNMINVCEILSKNKKNICYAVNGSWGVGKSFVLEMFEKQIKVIQNKKTATNQYSLFHYNCWHYDYYEEPLVAIVASMLDQIEENENIFSDKLKTKAKAVLKVIGNGLFTKGVNYVNEKTGVDFQKIIDVY